MQQKSTPDKGVRVYRKLSVLDRECAASPTVERLGIGN